MFRKLLIALLLLAPCPAAAKEAPADYAYRVHAWQAHDTRLISIGWRLARANAPLCRRTQNAIGLMLTDVRKYEFPDAARSALGIAGDIAVEAVATGSPAYLAGLQPGDEVLAIGGAAVSALPAPRAGEDSRLNHLHDLMDAALARQDGITLRVARPGSPAREERITGETVCRSRFALQGWGKSAQADGYVVLIAVQLLAEHSSDDEAATMLGHELAHNILNHNQRNADKGYSYVIVRRNEREADRLAPWLMANAGYDPAAGPRFMASWGPRHSGGITRAPTHDSYRDRVDMIAAELPVIAAARAAHPGQLLDWRSRFPVQASD